MRFIRRFGEIDGGRLELVGGKAANLGQLYQAGFPVPPGFCITTRAYRAFIEQSADLSVLLAKLVAARNVSDLEKQRELVRQHSERLRNHLGSLPMPPEVANEILHAWRQLGTVEAYAVRSSGTTEDLHTASFAGQYDTFLNVIGENGLLTAVRNCWLSLFTPRAITYRMHQGFVDDNPSLAVVVQEMLQPQAAGVVFTVDPVSGHRGTCAVDAVFGLGEALVQGSVPVDRYKVRDGEILTKDIADKELAVVAQGHGGTATQRVPLEKRRAQALTDEQIRALARLGKDIEMHYGMPQDVEWCLVGNRFHVVQSRPITTLYPVPEFSDNRLHILVSVGHLLMMPRPLSPMGLWCYAAMSPFKDYLMTAGSRLYLDATTFLDLRVRRRILRSLQVSRDGQDRRLASALTELVSRSRFQQETRSEPKLWWIALRGAVFLALRALHAVLMGDHGQRLARARVRIHAMADHSEAELARRSGAERLRFIRKEISTLGLRLFAEHGSFCVFPGIIATEWLERASLRVYGPEEGAKFISQISMSLPGSSTMKMGLALADVADAARDHPDIEAYLRSAADETFFSGLEEVNGSRRFHKAFAAFLQQYGAHGDGELDIASQRWRDAPTELAASILSHLHTSAPGAHRQRFEVNERAALEAAGDFVARVRRSPGGWLKARAVRRLIHVFRHSLGSREESNAVVARLFSLYRDAMLEEGAALVRSGRFQEADDVFFLTLPELIDVLEGRFATDLTALVEDRRARLARDRHLSPPLVLTSEGEMLDGELEAAQALPGALIGVAASAGKVEGTARVVTNLNAAQLEPGDILVAPFTDPSWTTLFPAATAVVTEVGGRNSHASVIAREYGLPAVVGVGGATQLITSGQRLRVDGTQGFVEILK